ncbi:hypothetical protein [Nitrospirillum viridazoti]|uniref:Uncharacterized protein n=1 Tax=Nitrospirillum viridazoti CBAmc TaxID=1441467 RepID=A0A248JT23_9PROT|nr:hypothetical protein [Nitrospirillum amazonense]ASG21650.1 hypothetical protein Y958_13200 [Nitrospirillum amazonense CBAmc]TWB42192.1 hypothetical protein FBZ91_103207 [Nitrospirillum amazonense]
MPAPFRLPTAALRRILCCALIMGTAFTLKPAVAAGIPFVGCPADGQMGPQAAPRKGTVPSLPPALAAKAAGRLAYYAASAEAGSIGSFAPKGWHCLALYGSNGSQLLVTANPLASPDLIKAAEHIQGPALQLVWLDGDTSGRFEVAQVAARVFPVAKDYVQGVIDEGLADKSEYTWGPYPTDTVVRHSPTSVDFVTPAGQKGMGTDSHLTPGPLPIIGSALLFPDDDMALRELVMRLPPEMADLGPVIQAAFRPE